ncbi:MAG: hypothetical protein IPM46_15085 [Flavobacteriales bacterium]|nr:hypothetical protein [Flavobacteriales bacterium]
MRHLRTLIATACVALLSSAYAQSTPCPGEPLIFQLEGEYYGTKTWEHSTDGVTWTTVVVIEDEPFILQPEQSGWYRVRFHDEACGIDYVSVAQRFVAHAIDLGDALTITIGGVVRNELGGPVSGATVRAGCGAGVSTTTDHFGVFLLQGVTAYEGLAYVTVEKEGYFTGSRSFVPGENADEAISHAYITLLQKSLAGTVQSANGGQVALEGVTINFPANAFVQNGQPYSGPLRVYLNHINPTSADLHTQMPGMLMGVMDEQPQLLLSYGMAGVELTDANGQGVQLASGSLATVRFPVMAAQQGTAPSAMPLWWFDEDLGYWVQEGEALRVGNEYVGQVAHFSWWNCDVPGNFVELKGVVFDSVNGGVLAGARIIVLTQSMGSGTTYTNTQGEFTGLVPISQQLTIQVQLPCGPNGSWVTVHTEVAGPYDQGSVIVLSVTLLDQNLVTGTVADCGGLPVESGYAQLNGVVHFCEDGVFEVFSCATDITLRGVDLATGNVSDYTSIELTTDTTDVGELLTCTPLFGTVTDINGNTYQTIIIGTQVWMTENLRTANYRDGSAIPLESNATNWSLLTTGAYCYLDNNSANDTIYGKLYNWYAAANPELCPLGWHLPTDAEWMTLESFLGMPPGELDTQEMDRGAAQNVGGKLKAFTLWESPNTGATNESGFSGLPGGYRTSNGVFINPGFVVNWWSATDIGVVSWIRGLQYNKSGMDRGLPHKRYGCCVRCLRD